MKPILKWPGGKASLLPYIKKYINPETLYGHVLYEPFIGGGALAFDLGYKYTVINDINHELINLYQVVRDYPETLIRELRLHQENHINPEFEKGEWYYEVRAWDREPNFWNRPAAEIAARTVYLNKTCFNGIFRVNSKGYFNTPIGRTTTGKCPDIVQETEIRELSKFLKGVKIREGDYAYAIRDLEPGDWVYLDPPYDPGEEIHTPGFVGYSKEGWTRHDLLRLRAVADEAVRKGAKVIISNNDTEFVREAFCEWTWESIDVARSINSKGSGRKGKELLIFSHNINR